MFLHAARRNVCSTFRNSNIRKFLRTFQEWHYARALHSRKHDHEVQLYAFDILALDGEDLRGLPLSMRKTNLALLLARRPDGIFVAPFNNLCRSGRSVDPPEYPPSSYRDRINVQPAWA
jgi:hypothetical protein